MTFEEQVIITVIDKGILAGIVIFIAFVFNWVLQRRKAHDELLHQMTPSRVDAYKKLWAITGEFITSRKDDIPKEKRLDVDGRLINWYYDEGGSLFLSWKATKCFLESVDILRNENSKSDVIRKTFSSLRTTLKRDCGIYSNLDVGREISQPREPLCPNKVQK